MQVFRRGKRREAPVIPDVLRPNPNPELSLNDIHDHHQSLVRNTQTRDWWQNLRTVLYDATKQSGSLPLITKAVCLGTGPYDPENGSITARKTAHLQTAAFRHIVNHFGKTLTAMALLSEQEQIPDSLPECVTGQKVQCYIQEPRFTKIDKEFCHDLDMDVVDSPDGFSIVDEQTILFGIHMELDIYNQALASQLPAVYIGSSLQEWENILGQYYDGKRQIKNRLTAFREMDKTYHKFEFPDFENMFSSTVMYWKKV